MSSERRREAPTALNSADPTRNFSLSTEERIRALTIGVPAWSQRKRNIEDDIGKIVEGLVELSETLAQKGRDPAEIARAVEAAAARRDLTKINAMVVKHNRYYPVEANLPMNSRGEYLVYGRVWRREEPFTAARLVALATAELARRAAPDEDG